MKTPSSKSPSTTGKTRAAKTASSAGTSDTSPPTARPRRAPAKTKAAAPAAKAAPKPRAKAAVKATPAVAKSTAASAAKVVAKPRAKAAAPAPVPKAKKATAVAKAGKSAKPARKDTPVVEPVAAKPIRKAAAPRRRKVEVPPPAVEAQGALVFAAADVVPAPPEPRAATAPPPAIDAASAPPEPVEIPSLEPEAQPAAATQPAVDAPPAGPVVNGSATTDRSEIDLDLDDHDWEEGTSAAISVDDVLAGVDPEHDEDDDDDEDEDEDEDEDDEQSGDRDEHDVDEDEDDDEEDDEDDDLTLRQGAHQGDDEDDVDDEDEEDDEDDTPLGETVTTEAGGGLDPAVAAAARRLGIQRLYPEQARTIREVIAGRDVLIVMPTGFGKSACYQVPSMLLPSPVVLISPLLALLKDQHEKLIKYNVPCVRIDGTVRGRARAEAMERIARGGPLLVMTTPETLGSEEMFHVLTKSGISLAAIDEAHCISEWGFDFRPAYLRLGETLRKLGRPPLLALTATATEKVRTDIVRFLGMRTPTIVASSPHRSNLAFEVLECREAARLRALARLAQRLRRPGIIYCSTTREVDTVYTILMRLGIPAHRYHGKMAAGDRVKQQEMYMKPGRRTVMVATSAFGLGIDKPDIRYVVHQQSPASLEQYVQEAGRAGRDGAKANCILLHDSSDRTVHEALLSRSRLRPDQLYKLGSALAAWAAEGRTPTIDALALSADLGERPTSALLATLEEAGLVKISEDFLVRATCAPAEVEERVRSLAGQFANMRTQDARRLDSVEDYARDGGCRAIYLRSYFGEDGGGACGLCDVCRGRPDRPSTFWSPVAAPKRMNKKRRRGRNGQQPQHQQRPQQGGGGRRRRGRRRRGGGQQNPQQMNMRQGGPNPNAQHGQQPRPPQHGQPQQHGGGNPQQQGGPPQQNQMGGGPNDGQQRRRRRRRRGRRGRRGRPNPSAPPPTPSSEG